MLLSACSGGVCLSRDASPPSPPNPARARAPSPTPDSHLSPNFRPPCSSTAVNSASSAPSPAPGVTATAARRALALGFRALGAACPLSSSSSPIPSALGAWAPEPGCAAACGESASLLSLVTAAAVRRGGDAKSEFRGGEARSVSSGPGLVSAGSAPRRERQLGPALDPGPAARASAVLPPPLSLPPGRRTLALPAFLRPRCGHWPYYRESGTDRLLEPSRPPRRGLLGLQIWWLSLLRLLLFFPSIPF